MRFSKKLLEFVFVLFLSVTSVFFVLRAAPGDPVEKILGPRATIEEISKMQSQLNLDKSVTQQYGFFLKSLVSGDLGNSLFKKKKVANLIEARFAPSFILGFFSVGLSFILGSLIGVFLAIKKNSFFDYTFRVVTILGLAFPIFSLAPIVVLVFSINLNLLPVSEWGSLKHMILPIITLTIPLTTILIRVVRTRFLDDLGEPFVAVLSAKGLGPAQIYLRVFKLSLPTILNVVAIQLSVVLGGTIITETIFDIPGLGLLLFEGIQSRDYPLVQGLVTFIASIYMAVYFLVEWLNESIDPRTRGGEK